MALLNGFVSEQHSEDDYQDQIDLAYESLTDSRWPGLTFEQGVQAALEWVTGQRKEPPIED